MADYDGKGMGRDTELILPPGVFAFVLDETKGHINTLCGPIKQSLSNTDRLVKYNPDTKRFEPSGQQQNAIQTNVIAPKGSYVILENPSTNGKQPEPGKAEVMPIGTLKMGQIENLSGPQSFPLWPGQKATVVKGHHLRSNQYLMVRVYDDEAAKANWDKSVVKGVATEGSDATTSKQSVLGIDKDTLVTGQLIVIRGTDVAFYIPPTGIEVLVDEDGEYIRDAVTLERLEYSILLGENGEKVYVKGPDVVFPTPTQQFYTKDGKRKFRAFELQPTTGIHIKVIEEYSENGTDFKAGDELFITGLDTPIYYPRSEHAIISYGGNEKSFAVAIPGGEGRYVLDRKTGVIDLIAGPAMFLPNPIQQVVVQRVLSDSECELYYPGNAEVLRINRERRGVGIDGGDIASAAAFESLDASSTQSFGSYNDSQALRTRSFAAAPAREKVGKGAFGDELNRGTKYTPPRTVTLNNKYEGAIRIDVWPGFAVQVVNSKGERKTVEGPQTVLLQYDEYLERLSLSKGKPKNPDNRMNTAFLRYTSNPVSDILSLKTNDLVNVSIQVKYLVRFDEASRSKWFSVDNYVQYMVDHLRSMIGNAVRNIGVQEFYQNAANVVRDIVLGKKDEETGTRPLKTFEENGMTVYDLELINITVEDAAVATLLSTSRQEALKDAIELQKQKTKLTLVQGQEEAKRLIAEELAATQELKDRLDAEQQERAAEARLDETEQQNNLMLVRKQAEKAAAEIVKATTALTLESEKARKELESEYAEAELERKIKLLVQEAASSKERMAAVTPGLVEALVAAANVGILEKVTPQMAALAFVNGNDLEATLGTMLKGTGAEQILNNLKNLSKARG